MKIGSRVDSGLKKVFHEMMIQLSVAWDQD